MLDLGANLEPIGTPRPLTRHKAAIHGIAWAPDGQSLVYAVSPLFFGNGMGSYLWRVAIDGAHAPERMESSRVGSFAPAATASRQRLVFVQSDSDIDIFRFEAPDRATPIAASSFVDYAPSFSPDGRRIAFESWRSGEAEEIWVSDPDGSNAFQVTRGPVDWTGQPLWRGNPTWSPDGRIAYGARGDVGNPDVWIVNADGSSRRRLTDDAFNDGLPIWSADGQWIYYRQDRPDGNDFVRIAASGGTPQRITHHGAVYATVSSDGKTLFYTKNAVPALFSVSVDGGVEQQVVGCVVGRALASVRDGLYYIGCAPGQAKVPLLRFDSKSGKTEQLGVLDQGVGIFMGLAVSPDTKTILFAQSVRESADLMMIENFR